MTNQRFLHILLQHFKPVNKKLVPLDLPEKDFFPCGARLANFRLPDVALAANGASAGHLPITDFPRNIFVYSCDLLC